MNTLIATFKKPITAIVRMDDSEKDILLIVEAVKNAKEGCFWEIKKQMHQRIELLSMDDFKFELKDN